MTFVSTSMVNNSAVIPMVRCRGSHLAPQIATHFQAAKVASSAESTRLVWKPHGHQLSVLAVGQISPAMSNQARSSNGGTSSPSRRLEYDVVIVGAGIIGLATAHHILLHTNLSVALIDAAEPCAGATGAGQGYIWMSHRTPGSPNWALASRSKLLWEALVAELKGAGVDPLQAMGWKNTGSLLVASTTEEAEALQKSVAAALTAGVHAEYMSATEARKAEPALSPDYLTAAAFFPEDSQIDARLMVAFLQQGREMYCKKAVVVATGAWSSKMMLTATADWGFSIVPPVMPRKGHLLVLREMENVKLRHGIMEYEYLSHSQRSHVGVVERSDQHEDGESPLELAMTATLDQHGNLLLGSSREFVGFDNDIHTEVVESIVNRARKFLWGLSDLSFEHILRTGQVRTGLRPFVPDGRPLIGSVEDVPGLIFATGHEGSGLCLALATAEMVVDIIQGVECIMKYSFFSPVGRVLPCERM